MDEWRNTPEYAQEQMSLCLQLLSDAKVSKLRPACAPSFHDGRIECHVKPNQIKPNIAIAPPHPPAHHPTHPRQSHPNRERAFRQFKQYISEWQPEMYDDDVTDFLRGQEGKTEGLLSWCGQLSTGKGHDGQLKRSAKPAIGLVRWLLQLEDEGVYPADENLFLSQFLSLDVSDYHSMQLCKHITHSDNEKGGRGGNRDDGLELVAIILQKHQTEEGQHDRVKLDALLPEPEARSIFSSWLQETALDEERDDILGVNEKTEADESGDGVVDGAAMSARSRRQEHIDMIRRHANKYAPTEWKDVRLDLRMVDGSNGSSMADAAAAESPGGGGAFGSVDGRRDSIDSISNMSMSSAGPGGWVGGWAGHGTRGLLSSHPHAPTRSPTRSPTPNPRPTHAQPTPNPRPTHAHPTRPFWPTLTRSLHTPHATPRLTSPRLAPRARGDGRADPPSVVDADRGGRYRSVGIERPQPRGGREEPEGGGGGLARLDARWRGRVQPHPQRAHVTGEEERPAHDARVG